MLRHHLILEEDDRDVDLLVANIPAAIVSAFRFDRDLGRPLGSVCRAAAPEDAKTAFPFLAQASQPCVSRATIRSIIPMCASSSFRQGM